jgi:hypothetical protein
MVNEQNQDSGRSPANQWVRDVFPEPNEINVSIPYDFNGKNLTPYDGLLAFNVVSFENCVYVESRLHCRTVFTIRIWMRVRAAR